MIKQEGVGGNARHRVQKCAPSTGEHEYENGRGYFARDSPRVGERTGERTRGRYINISGFVTDCGTATAVDVAEGGRVGLGVLLPPHPPLHTPPPCRWGVGGQVSVRLLARDFIRVRAHRLDVYGTPRGNVYFGVVVYLYFTDLPVAECRGSLCSGKNYHKM